MNPAEYGLSLSLCLSVCVCMSLCVCVSQLKEKKVLSKYDEEIDGIKQESFQLGVYPLDSLRSCGWRRCGVCVWRVVLCTVGACC